MRKIIIVFVLSFIFVGFFTSNNMAVCAEFELFDTGKKGIIDYEKYGEFQRVGTADYK